MDVYATDRSETGYSLRRNWSDKVVNFMIWSGFLLCILILVYREFPSHGGGH